MDILINVSKQRLKLATNLKKYVSGSQEFVRFVFGLNSYWRDLLTFAQFAQNGNTYNRYLDDENAVYLPSEIVAGECTLTLFGSGNNVIATTNYLTLTIDENILVSDASSTDISESLYEQLVDMVRSVSNGTAVVDTTSKMTDKNKIYVYIGSETGMTNGNWYYWNGTVWTSGGVWNAVAVETDKTLSVEDKAADGKAAGSLVEVGSTQPTSSANKIWIDPTDEEIEIPEMSDLNAVDAKVDDLKSDINEITEAEKNLFDKDHINVINGYIDSGSDSIASNTNARTVFMPCDAITTYTVSKTSATKRFSVGYTETVPDVGTSVSGILTYNNNTAISITTGANAQYLVVWVYLSTADTLTFEQICAMLQIEKSASATAYEPYKISAIDNTARKELDGFERHPIIQSDSPSAMLGNEMVSSISDFSVIGSSVYENGKWTIPSESGISMPLSVIANVTYIIAITVPSGGSNVTDGSGMYTVNPLTITLGSDSIDIFANYDGNWVIGLRPTVTETATLSLVCGGALVLQITGISIKPVTSFSDETMRINNNPVYVSEFGAEKNIAIGNGHKVNATGNSNTAVGYNAQANMSTGIGNTAYGAYSQYKTRTGSKNVAIGDNTQVETISGMFNCAMGTAAQKNLTIGSWNNAIGNEAQRDITTGCNNTALGRRAQSYITSGNMNTAIGSMTGFAREGHQAGDWATKTSSYQTLVGGESTQATTGTADYLTTLGFRAKGNEKAIAIGANSSATGTQSIAIGYGVESTNDNEVVIGSSGDSIILCGKIITFNQDGTVTWSSLP